MVIGIATVLSVASAHADGQDGYSIRTNDVGRVGIFWNGDRLLMGSIENAVVSPDGQSAAWVEPYLTEHPGIENEGGQEATPGGHLWVAHGGTDPAMVERPDTSRGIKIIDAQTSALHAWYPHNLHWDSRSRLYFMAAGSLTSGYLWRIGPNQHQPTLMSFVIDYQLRRDAGQSATILAYRRSSLDGANAISYRWSSLVAGL